MIHASSSLDSSSRGLQGGLAECRSVDRHAGKTCRLAVPRLVSMGPEISGSMGGVGLTLIHVEGGSGLVGAKKAR